MGSSIVEVPRDQHLGFPIDNLDNDTIIKQFVNDFTCTAVNNGEVPLQCTCIRNIQLTICRYMVVH